MERFAAERFVLGLASATIGATFNQYAASPLLRRRLVAYLEERAAAPVLLVGEAAGYRGARVSGLPFTSERQLTGTGPAEATATVVQRALGELGAAGRVLLWNLVPTHPHRPGLPESNRPPARAEVEAAAPFLEELARGRRVLAVGRLAERRLGCPYLRHPSHGGAAAFRDGLCRALAPDPSAADVSGASPWTCPGGTLEERLEARAVGSVPA